MVAHTTRPKTRLRQPAWLSLALLPETFWNGLTGAVHAARNPSVRSFLELCAALAQIGLLLAAGLFRLWYRR